MNLCENIYDITIDLNVLADNHIVFCEELAGLIIRTRALERSHKIYFYNLFPYILTKFGVCVNHGLIEDLNRRLFALVGVCG